MSDHRRRNAGMKRQCDFQQSLAKCMSFELRKEENHEGEAIYLDTPLQPNILLMLTW
jgi:hypothetical protein